MLNDRNDRRVMIFSSLTKCCLPSLAALTSNQTPSPRITNGSKSPRNKPFPARPPRCCHKIKACGTKQQLMRHTTHKLHMNQYLSLPRQSILSNESNYPFKKADA